MQDKQRYIKDILYLALGEVVAAAAVVAIYVLLGAFSYKAVTGALLGAAVATLNYLILTLSVNRAVDRFMALRGESEMDDEEAEKFASEHVGEIQNAQKLSYIVRTVTVLGTLVLAFLSKQFDVIATVVPLLLFQPILIVTQKIASKEGKHK